MASIESVEGGVTTTRVSRRCLELNVKFLYLLGFWPAEGEEERNWWFYWRYLVPPVTLTNAHCLGFWPAEGEEERNWWFYWRYFLPRVTLIRAFYGSIFHVINIYIVWGDIPRMAEYFAMVALHIMIFIKVATLFYYHEELKAMFDQLDALHDPRMVFNDHMRDSLNSKERVIHKLSKTALISYSTLVTFSLVLQVLEGFIKRAIPFRLWMPYSYEKSPIFEITLIFTMTASFFDLLILVLCFTTFIAPAILTVTQFKLLSYKLENTREHVEKKMKAKMVRRLLTENTSFPRSGLDNMAEVMNVPLTRIASREISLEVTNKSGVDVVFAEFYDDKLDTTQHEMETIVADDLTPSRSHIIAARELRNRFPLTKAEDVEMERYLRHCIKHHQKLLHICKTLGHVFRMMLYLYVFYSALGGILTLYLTTMVETMDSKMMGIFLLMMALYFQLLCLCLIGGQISEQAENARDAVYDCDWFGASESFKLSMRIMVSRMNRPLVIKAGGLPLSVGTYRLICRAAYYCHIGVNKLIRGEKIMSQG